MASITGVFAGHGTLVAATVDTVTLSAKTSGTGPSRLVEVVNEGSGTIYVSINGATPTVAGSDTFSVPAGVTKEVPFGTGVFKLISSGTPAYSVHAKLGS